MRVVRHPLPATNPEFSILEHSSFSEYRVENWRLARDGSGRIVAGTSGFTWREAFLAIIISVWWHKIQNNPFAALGLALFVIRIIWRKCSQVLYESLIVLPLHGIQVETHRGFPSLRMNASRKFIPMSAFQDFVINEGLKGWDVRYYAAVITSVSPEDYTVQVVYENTLPHFPVLHEVYRAVHDSLSIATSASNDA